MAMEAVQASSRNSMETNSRPRISFSADFLDETNFISINPHSQTGDADKDKDKTAAARVAVADFEFLSSNGNCFPFWQMHHSEKLKQINLRKESGGDGEGDDDDDEREVVENEESSRVSWFVDDDPSPRPPKCTVLWKELLRLKKQRATSSLSPSSSSLADVAEEGKQGSGNRDNKHVKRIKKGLERTRSASIRIRPMINVPICTQVKSSALPPLFPLKKGRILER
ncbi:hypothetical protein GOBAR_AA34301 [Gossypium barbadense]|uniref:Uncharacterized protein n=1 Tax=Gossypium barbadense TaxID=3634 RepID=A0A2P5W5N1_GOSBA|nr:hypothetical protein GOBAR_AA34301 [Gossypium barbadense]